MVSKRLQSVPASGTVKIANLVSQMKADGVDIVSFSMGEPDFNTPDNIVESCVKSVRDGFTHYTPSMGIAPLRKAIADDAVRKGIPCKASNVLVTPTKQAIFMIALAYLDPGDEVLLPDPTWVSYEAVIRLAGAEPVYVNTRFENGFVIDPADVEAAITPRTKMLIINSPSNPTGCVQPEKVLREISKICADRGIKVMSDEIYEHVIYEGKHFPMASFKDSFDNTLTVSGLSKTYAMTGWRVGWVIASEEDIKAINKLQTHSITCCTSFTQPAAVEALTGPQDSRRTMIAEFKKRRDLALDLVNDIPGLECNKPDGAFYLFPKYDIDMKSADLAERLLQEGHVAVTPGRAFGPAGEGFFRISYATSESQIIEGFSRIKKGLARL
ncbi:MAG: pyridoxal phosphate-dependent aminotransferase [Thermoplasmatales archaeon]|jgi:aspartate aminotransferase|nr:pyridoxal phosphate-dependent aminotransferase [Thermoplasmatales archaeon]